MRAKNEFRNIADTYDTKLILERVVDGKLMCPEACCGAPVVECTCGEDCPHCNCFMIHKAMKDKDFTDKLLKENLRQHGFFKKGIGSAVKEIFDIPKDEPKEDEEKRLRATNVQQMQIIDNDVKNLKISPEEAIKRSGVDPAYHKDLLRRYKKWAEREASFKDIKPASWYKTPEVKEPSLREILGLEDEEFNPRRDAPEHKEGDPHPATRAAEEIIGTMVKFWRDGPMFGEVVDVDVEQGFAVVETGSGHMRVGPSEKWVVELGELTKATPRKPRSTQTRFPETRPGRPGYRPAEDNEDSIIPEDERDEPIRKRPEDNEEPKRGITGYQHTDALAQAAFAKKDKVDIDEIDLNRWREYPAEDVMKAVYRRYGRELPSVDSYDWAISWDKKIRPWLKEHEGNL